MFGNKRRKAIRALNRVSWDHALRIEMLETKIRILEEAKETPPKMMVDPDIITMQADPEAVTDIFGGGD